MPSPRAKCQCTGYLDPRGEHNLRYRCKNVNLVEKTVKGVEDEMEFLFVPCALPHRPNAYSLTLTLYEQLLCIHRLVRPHSRQNHR